MTCVEHMETRKSVTWRGQRHPAVSYKIPAVVHPAALTEPPPQLLLSRLCTHRVCQPASVCLPICLSVCRRRGCGLSCFAAASFLCTFFSAFIVCRCTTGGPAAGASFRWVKARVYSKASEVCMETQEKTVCCTLRASVWVTGFKTKDIGLRRNPRVNIFNEMIIKAPLGAAV